MAAGVVQSFLRGAIGPLKRLGGAALDVFEHEPQVPPQFFALDNVVLVPHIASATVQTRQATQRVLDNLDAFVAGQPMPSAVQAP